MEAKPENASVLVPAEITELGFQYVAAYQQTLSKKLGKNSIKAYANSLSHFGMFLNNSSTTIFGISREMVIKYLGSRTSTNSNLRLSNNSASANLSAIKSFLKMCHKNGINVDPEIYDISIPNYDRGKRPLIQISLDEFRLLLSTIRCNTGASLRDYAVISTLFYGLLKSSEVRKLRVEDFNSLGDKHFFSIKRRQSISNRECPESLKDVISSYLERTHLADNNNAYLFPSSHGKSGFIYPDSEYGSNSLWAMVRRRGKRASLRNEISTPTAIRSGGISHLLSETDNLELVRKRVGHRSPHTTSFYIPKVYR